MCLRWNWSKGKGKHFRMKWNRTWKNQYIWCMPEPTLSQTRRSEPKLKCKLQSYERSLKRCCDSQTHLWITIPTLLPLSCARTERCSQSAAGLSQAASTVCCSRVQLLWSPARRLIPGSNPLLLRGCSWAGRSSKLCKYSHQCSVLSTYGKHRAGIRASAKACVHSKSRSQDIGLDFHHYKQQVQQKPDMQLYT